MKKVMVAVAVATFVFTSCSEAKKETTTATTEHHEGESTAAAGKVVVEAPDYQANAEAVKPQIEQILTSYLKLKEEMTDSDAQSAKAHAQSILEAAAQVKVTDLPAGQQPFATEKLKEIKDSAARIEGATNIKDQRASLELLSEATFALTKAFGATTQKLFYQHCPMANDNQGAYWLSATKEIRNPYYGQEMLNCGSTEEVYN
jgi:Protein of unknown function (DUF3347)